MLLFHRWTPKRINCLVLILSYCRYPDLQHATPPSTKRKAGLFIHWVQHQFRTVRKYQAKPSQTLFDTSHKFIGWEAIQYLTFECLMKNTSSVGHVQAAGRELVVLWRMSLTTRSLPNIDRRLIKSKRAWANFSAIGKAKQTLAADLSSINVW